MTWLTGWTKRVKITIDQTDITAALSNFPVLIYLSTSSGRNSEDVSFIFDEVGANSLKIAVTEDDGTTECYVEVEKWDNGNEKAWLWAKIPSIASGADTDIYLYYDNDHANNTDKVGPPNSVPAENVWDANFKFVCHMRDDPDNTAVRDSTTNDNDGAKSGAAQPAIITNGQINGAQDFDGTGDFITIPADPSLDLRTGDWQIGMWVNLHQLKNNWFFALGTGAHYKVIGFQQGAPGQLIWMMDADGVAGWDIYHAVAGAIPLTTWTKFELVRSGNTVTMYKNGTTNLGSDVLAGAYQLNNFEAYIGRWYWAAGYEVHGDIDEVRVATSARSAAWRKASYESEIDDLLDFGAEENVVLVLTEIISLSDPGILIIQDIFAMLSEIITLSDTYERLISMQRQFIETVSTNDIHERLLSMQRQFVESVSLNDERLLIVQKLLAEIVSLSDTWERLISILRQFDESVSLSGSMFKGVGADLIETIALSDTLIRILALQKILTDSIDIALYTTLDMILTLPKPAESLSLTDNILKGTAKAPFTETVTVSDTMPRILSLQRILVEAATLSDTLLRQLSLYKILLETISPSDNIVVTRVLFKILTETLVLSDNILRQLVLQRIFMEELLATDTCERLLSALKQLTEAISLNDTYERIFSIWRQLVETASLSDTHERLISIQRLLAETASISDTYNYVFSAQRLLTEIVALSDSVFKGIGMDLIDATILFDTLLRISEFEKDITEAATLSDILSRQLSSYRTLAETIALSDSLLRQLILYKTLVETITLLDAHSYVWNIEKVLAETVVVQDALTRLTSFFKINSEVTALSDTLLRAVARRMILTETILLWEIIHGVDVGKPSAILDTFNKGRDLSLVKRTIMIVDVLNKNREMALLAKKAIIDILEEEKDVK